MTTKRTPPAKKTYRVWADQMTRVYQEVEADTPEQAHALAWERPDCWEDCSENEKSEYRLSNDVQVVGTDDYFTVVDVEHCETCGSEIEETVNDSNFGDGECGPCEYERYKHPRTPGAFFTLVDEDLQGIAREKFKRELTPEELHAAIKGFENGINWYETAECAVEFSINDHAHGNAA